MRKVFVLVIILFTLAFSQIEPAALARSVSGSAQTQGNPSTKVWVNTKSAVYHCPGSRWYGTTKNGEYMTQKQAQAAGNRPAYGTVCG